MSAWDSLAASAHGGDQRVEREREMTRADSHTGLTAIWQTEKTQDKDTGRKDLVKTTGKGRV